MTLPTLRQRIESHGKQIDNAQKLAMFLIFCGLLDVLVICILLVLGQIIGVVCLLVVLVFLVWAALAINKSATALMREQAEFMRQEDQEFFKNQESSNEK